MLTTLTVQLLQALAALLTPTLALFPGPPNFSSSAGVELQFNTMPSGLAKLEQLLVEPNSEQCVIIKLTLLGSEFSSQRHFHSLELFCPSIFKVEKFTLSSLQ